MITEEPLARRIEQLPDRIRAEMARRRTTGEHLADLMGISYATFKRRMSRPGEFTLQNLADAADALRCTPERLLDGGP